MKEITLDLKEKEYSNFDQMVREMQYYLLDNEGRFISVSPFDFGVTKFAWCHVETKQIFSIKTKDIVKADFNVFQKYDGVVELTKFINDIERLKQADAVGNVKGNQ